MLAKRSQIQSVNTNTDNHTTNDVPPEIVHETTTLDLECNSCLNAPEAILEISTITQSPGWITFDASKSMDINGNPCISFLFDFGDRTPPVIISSPTTSRPYKKIRKV